ncbi:sigma-70 family RNA polymerase sigma factor [Actinomadura sp. DC4]|uniref:sigma-70 family RNA polymerase sigma factor n=1 Tax=Actinomadura sp. DC4 TaxID=3055069 RepID=UPI0025B0EB9B|nr:sigma-70 family RNA polymerase sigma factor [Actinomadura sp. DC4]MDN3358985.1 sigma-70 family RNA polymerase sigma factor [Actinomadura sp. DC4]
MRKDTNNDATLDEARLAELYRRHGAPLLYSLTRLTNGDRAKAEDILQETLVRAWRNPKALDCGPAACRRWLFTVARRIAIDHFRMVAARPTEIPDEAPQERVPAYDPYDELVDAYDMEAVLTRLPRHHHDVVVELHLRDRSIADTARLLGVPIGTVKSRNHHAIRALRSIFAEEETDTAA